MLSTADINDDIKQTEKDLITLRKFELDNLKQLLEIIESDNWSEVNFILQLKKEDAQKINRFDFKSCMDEKIIFAMKKLIKIGVSESIKEREEILSSLENLKK